MKPNRNARGAAMADLRYSAVPAWANRLPALRHVLSDWAADTGMAVERVEDLTLAAYEAMANVVEHAYPDGAGTFDLRASHLPGERCVQVTITDRGQWVPPAADPGPLHGRGLPLMRHLADSADVRPGSEGTEAVLRWRL